jgi:hypothetical protein
MPPTAIASDASATAAAFARDGLAAEVFGVDFLVGRAADVLPAACLVPPELGADALAADVLAEAVFAGFRAGTVRYLNRSEADAEAGRT